MVVHGDVTLADYLGIYRPSLSVTANYPPPVGQVFTIVQSTGTLTGTYSSASTFDVSCGTFQLDYNPSSVTLTRVAGNGTPVGNLTIAAAGPQAVCTRSGGGTVSVTESGGCNNVHRWGYRTVPIGPISPIVGQTAMQYQIDGGDFPGPGTYHLVETTTPAIGSPLVSNEIMITVLATAPSRLHTLAPCRLIDTRDVPGPLGGPSFTPGQIRSFVVAGACGIPSTAQAIAVNATAVGATAPGSFRIASADAALSPSTTLSFPAEKTIANNAVVALPCGTSGDITVANESAGTVHLIMDVSGYFE